MNTITLIGWLLAFVFVATAAFRAGVVRGRRQARRENDWTDVEFDPSTVYVSASGEIMPKRHPAEGRTSSPAPPPGTFRPIPTPAPPPSHD
jgi:hypothetical protein